MGIEISLENKRLTLTQNQKVLMNASIVSGCDDSRTVRGSFKSGSWIPEKTNPKHSGPEGWARDPWGNPYGPYFLEIVDKQGVYTTLGIHGTRGPGWAPVASPPIPQKMLSWFISKEKVKYLYCSHGCIRLSNREIARLFKLTFNDAKRRGSIGIEIK